MRFGMGDSHYFPLLFIDLLVNQNIKLYVIDPGLPAPIYHCIYIKPCTTPYNITYNITYVTLGGLSCTLLLNIQTHVRRHTHTHTLGDTGMVTYTQTNTRLSSLRFKQGT